MSTMHKKEGVLGFVYVRVTPPPGRPGRGVKSGRRPGRAIWLFFEAIQHLGIAYSYIYSIL